MANKKKVTPKTPLIHRKVVLHKSLEKPVHNLIGYSVLLILAVVTLVVIFSMQQGV
jgi:hypothetical protein